MSFLCSERDIYECDVYILNYIQRLQLYARDIEDIDDTTGSVPFMEDYPATTKPTIQVEKISAQIKK